MPVTSYSRTPDSNNSASPNGAPEGMAPSGVNNTIRQIMTDIVNEAAKNQAKVLGSVSGTDTITASMSPALNSYSAQMMVVFTPAATNTGAVTLNINSLGALDVLTELALQLPPGALRQGVPALLLLDSGADDWILVNPVGYGSFTGTLTGFGSNPTGTITYRVNKNLVTLHAESEISGTSNATTMTMTGLPSGLNPGGNRVVLDGMLMDNGGANPTLLGRATIEAAGTIRFGLYSSSVFSNSAFTSSGSKGLRAGWSITYSLL